MTEQEIEDLLARIQKAKDKVDAEAKVKTEDTLDAKRHANRYRKRLFTEKSGLIQEPPRQKDFPESLKIQRIAMSQNLVDISDRVTMEHYELLCDLLNFHLTASRKNAERLLLQVLEKSLTPLIPPSLIKAYGECPRQYVKRMPSFVYQASEDYGGGKILVVQPDLPYYIRQGTEMDAILDNAPERLRVRMDELVALHHKCLDREKLKAKKLRALVYSQCGGTYYGLLRAMPRWFYVLYEELRRRKEENDGGDGNAERAGEDRGL